MTRDEIISITKQILGQVHISSPHLVGDQVALMCTIDDVGRLIDGVAALEREECAKVCDDRAMANENAANECYDKDDISSLRSAAWQMTVCAEAIRARGK